MTLDEFCGQNDVTPEEHSRLVVYLMAIRISQMLRWFAK